MTDRLDISPRLEQDIAIPLRINGAAGAYSIRTISPSGASISEGVVYFDQSQNRESVALEFQATNDTNEDDETITLAIDEDNLPPGYGVDANNSWTINIADNDMREVGFRYGNTPIWGRQQLDEAQASSNLQLYIDPAPESGQRPAISLLIDGDSDAYGIHIHVPSGARYEASSWTSGTVHFDPDRDTDFVALRVRARQDFDNDNDTVRLAIDRDNLPDGYYLGENISWELTIIDNRERSISFVVPDATPDQIDSQGGVNFSPRIGESVVVMIQSSTQEYIETCVEYAENDRYLGGDYGYGWSPRVALDDHPRGSGDGDRVSVSVTRINDWTIKYRFTVRKTGLYSVWMKDVGSVSFDNVVDGDITRVNIRPQE